MKHNQDHDARMITLTLVRQSLNMPTQAPAPTEPRAIRISARAVIYR